MCHVHAFAYPVVASLATNVLELEDTIAFGLPLGCLALDELFG